MAKKQKSLSSDPVADVTVEPQTKEIAKTGRPSKYTEAIALSICEQLSEGIPLREICRQEGMPAWRTVYDWMWRNEQLSTAIARARDIGYDKMAEECLYIADNLHMGKKKVFTSGADDDEDSVTVTEEDMLGHRKLQIETRLKLLAKFNPKRYGDFKPEEEKIDHLIVDVEVKTRMDVAIKRLELIRIAE
jgi:predicted secreted protein